LLLLVEDNRLLFMQSIYNIPVPTIWMAVVKQVFGLEAEIEAVRFYESKKNQVSKLRLRTPQGLKEVIAKKYVWGDGDAEFSVLKKAYSLELGVPRPIAHIGGVLFTEAVEGEKLRAPVSVQQAEGLGGWLNRFHKAMTPAPARGTFLRGDCRLVNFLFQAQGQKIYGLDFEQAYFGSPELEVAEFMASLLAVSGTERILQSWPLAAILAFLRGYGGGLDLEGLYECTTKNLHNSLEFCPERVEEIQATLHSWQTSKKEILQELARNWEGKKQS